MTQILRLSDDVISRGPQRTLVMVSNPVVSYVGVAPCAGVV